MNPAVAPLRRRPASRLARLAAPLVNPALFDFWASRVHPTWSWERPLARVVARHAASRDAVTLVLKPNRHFAGVAPGQHVNITAPVAGARVTRSYSPSAAPTADGSLAITVRRVEGGRLSVHLCDSVRVGDVLDIGPAFGALTLPATAQGRWLFLAAGSGITPLMAMTRALAAQGMPVPLTLVYWARHRDELCFSEELRALAAAHPEFRVRFALTGDTASGDDECSGRISAALLADAVDDLPSQQVFGCGPGGFVEQARSLLAATSRSFLAEAFSPPPVVPGSAHEDAGTVQLTLATSGRTLTVPRGQSLLTAMEAQGIKPPSGCRMGICNTCSCAKASGTTRHLHTGDIAREPDTALKLCVNGATTDLVIEL